MKSLMFLGIVFLGLGITLLAIRGTHSSSRERSGLAIRTRGTTEVSIPISPAAGFLSLAGGVLLIAAAIKISRR